METREKESTILDDSGNQIPNIHLAREGNQSKEDLARRRENEDLQLILLIRARELGILHKE